MINANFSWNNNQPQETGLQLVKLGLASNYGPMTKLNNAQSTVYTNNTAATDRPELIKFSSRTIDKVDSKIDVAYPLASAKGVTYAIQCENVLTLTSSDDASYRVDLPIVVNLSVRHPKSEYVTDQIIKTLISRTVSAMFTDSGALRVNSLMRETTQIDAD